MRWVIDTPARSKDVHWGDHRFALCLSRQLQRLGQQVTICHREDWDRDFEADVVLLLRGKFAHEPKTKAIHAMWIISHPDSVTQEECAPYQLVFSASASHAKLLSQRFGREILPLLQCTDVDLFMPPETEEKDARQDVVFIGNTRGVLREPVLWAAELGLPLKVWGRGWTRILDPRLIVAPEISATQIPKVFQRAKFTINDHWRDMRENGYVNDRVFDALAAGLPIITDAIAEVEEIAPETCLFFRTRSEFERSVERLWFEYPLLLEQARQASASVRSNHSYEHRARYILEAVRRISSLPRGGAPGRQS